MNENVVWYKIQGSIQSTHKVEIGGDVELWGSNRQMGKLASAFELTMPETLAR